MARPTAQQAQDRRKLNLTYDDVKQENPNWSPRQINDYIDKQVDIDSVQVSISNLQIEVDVNAADIATNTADIATNTADIATNTTNIATNTANITTVTNNFNAHDVSDSEHGVTGDNVGTGDFAQTAIGGVVLLADLVSDAVASTVSVTSPDAPAAAATYSQADTQATVDLVNEMKGDVNQLVADLNNAITQLNDLIQKMKDANQMSTT